MPEDDIILKLDSIVKIFPGVKALDGVHLEIKKGEIHALCGENGAGKSTLMKIISGAHPYTSGNMYFEGEKISFHSTKEARDKGISMIYQEFNLVPYLSVAENIFLEALPKKKNGLFDWKTLNQKAKELLKRLKLNVDPQLPVNKLSVAQAQMVEIAKCLSRNAKVIIMDEPTAALTDEEIDILFSIIRSLSQEGISIIYISHRLDEIFKLADRVTVFRDGKNVATKNIGDIGYQELVSMMVGKDISDLYPHREYSGKETVLEAKNITGRGVKDVSFELKKGEILGIAGLMGSGNIELSKILYGAIPMEKGEIKIGNAPADCSTPRKALRSGIGFVSDDRKNEGLILIRSVKENISLSSLKKICRHSLVNHKAEEKMVTKNIRSLNIKVSSYNQLGQNLSGGNQQKVVFAKILETVPSICIMDEPTRGVDVGAKSEIYQIMNRMTEEGKSIILVSSDLPELIGMSDRILIMREGKIVMSLNRNESNQELILAYAAGGVGE
ncbi:MAG: sugar ABC transporter ATP-binding protein [bacterium]